MLKKLLVNGLEIAVGLVMLGISSGAWHYLFAKANRSPEQPPVKPWEWLIVGLVLFVLPVAGALLLIHALA